MTAMNLLSGENSWIGAAVVSDRIIEKRKRREQEIGKLELSKPTPKKADLFVSEARNNFVNGSYLSCIFASATAVEQIYKYEYILASNKPELARKELTIQKITFGRLIGKCNNIKRLKGTFRLARKLCNLRNEVAVHPPSIDTIFPEDSLIERRRKNRTFVKDIRILQKHLDLSYVTTFNNTILEYSDGDVRKRVTFNQILKNKIYLDKDIVWTVATDVLSYKLALKGETFMDKILKKMYGKK